MANFKTHGGKRAGAGRPSKADEIKTIESMDAVAAPHQAWEMLWQCCEQGNIQALKVWLAYRYGPPRHYITSEDGQAFPVDPWRLTFTRTCPSCIEKGEEP
jgi:hypothetical protein